MAYLQYHELGPRNHTTRRERLRALRVQVHTILGEDWDVRPVPRQRRSLELMCHAAAAEPHAGPDLCAQAALWDMRRQGLSLQHLQYGFTTSAWCMFLATVLSQRCALSMPQVTELSFETETLQGSRLLRAQVRGCKTLLKEKFELLGGARSALRRPINPHEVHAVRFPFVAQVS